MNQDNPYSAPQTTDLHAPSVAATTEQALGSAQDFRWFWVGSLLWLIGIPATVVSFLSGPSALLWALLLLFLLGTSLLAAIPEKTPGRDWFVGSCLLQMISPGIAFLAIQDVPNPDWDRFVWYQRLGIWGELLALLCVLQGIYDIGQWVRFPMLRWSSRAGAILLVLSTVSDGWFRSLHLGYEAILYSLLWGVFCFLPFIISLFVCLICALFVPTLVSQRLDSSINLRTLPTVIDIPNELLQGEQQ